MKVRGISPTTTPLVAMSSLVTHYFGHPGDDSTSMCSISQNDLFPKKSNFFLPLQN
jgi:hypothetical protein